MGLDMYLSGKKYIKDWNHNYPDGVIPDDSVEKQVAKAVDINLPVTHVEFELGYWRKANAIHQWFVKNVQGDEDNCQESCVSEEKLKELLSLVEQVLADTTRAGELLPPQAGFFFGSTDIDEWYFQDLESTKEILTKAIEAQESLGIEVYYSASW